MSHPLLAPLSLRELTVIRLIASSFSNKEIASQLGLSVKTVEKHRQNAMDEIGCHDIAAVTRFAIRTELITP